MSARKPSEAAYEKIRVGLPPLDKGLPSFEWPSLVTRRLIRPHPDRWLWLSKAIAFRHPFLPSAAFTCGWRLLNFTW